MCYYCKVSLDAGCYDPFNKSSMTDANEVDFGSEYVCAVSFFFQKFRKIDHIRSILTF